MKYQFLGAVCVLFAVSVPANASASPCDGRTVIEPPSMIVDGQPLTLPMAFLEVRRASPAVRAAGLEIRARAAEAEQAGRRLNPNLSIEFENFAGSGALSGFGENETTFAVEQTFRLGDKRGLAQRAGRAFAALGSAQCSLILREAELEVATLFYELNTAIAVKKLADASSELARRLADIVAKRVEAGAAAPPELSRVRTDAALALAAAASTEAEIDRLRFALAVFWGSENPRFSEPLIAGDGATHTAPPQTTPHPAIKRAEAATELARAQQKYQSSRRMPDVTLSAGVRKFEGSGEQAFVAGLSVPLPLFDRKQDARRAAGFRTQANIANNAAVSAKLLADQRASIASVKAARFRFGLLQDDALPAAQAAFDATLQGYAIGKFDLTTTISARKSLIETRFAVIEAELDLAKADMRLRSLIGAVPFHGE